MASALAAMLALGVGACSTKPQADPNREPVQRLLPRFTEAVTGSAADMLTNLDGFHCDFTVTFGASDETQPPITGELHERDGKLCFEPVFKKSEHKGIDSGTFSLIWDTTANRGFVTSEALQGFASVTSPAGTEMLQVDHAKDWNGLATRIQSQDASHPFTLTLSNIKPGLPPPAMFAPPDGFTSYDSEGALLSELATRQRTVMGLGHRDEGDLGPYQTAPGMQRPKTGASPGY